MPTVRWPNRAIGWPRHGSACPTRLQAATLRQTVLSAGVQNVEVVAEAEAAAALARSVGADAALLLADDDIVSLTVVGEDEESTSVLASVPIGAAGAAVACAAVLQQLPAAEVTRIMLVGQRLDLDSIAAELRSTAPVEVPPDAGYAIARGAAQTVEDAGFPAGAATQMAPAVGRDEMALAASDATQMAPAAADATQMAQAADPGAVGPQLAYSQEEPDYYEMPADSIEEFIPEQEDEAPYTAVIAPPPPRTLLMGSALAYVVMGLRDAWRSRLRSPFGRRPTCKPSRRRPFSRIRCRAGTCRRCRTSPIRWRCRSRWCRRRLPLRPRRVSRPIVGR